MVFIFEESEVLRQNLVELCGILEYECRAFATLAEGVQELQKVFGPDAKNQAPQVGGGEGVSPKGKKRTGAALWKKAAGATMKKGGSRFSEAVLRAVKAAREREKLARVVLLGASLFGELTTDMVPDDVYVALASEPDEFETVGRSLLARTNSRCLYEDFPAKSFRLPGCLLVSGGFTP